MPVDLASLEAIRQSITEYCDAHHQFSFDPNDPVVRLHEPTFSAPEIIAAVEVLLSTRVTMGAKVCAFEREYAERFLFEHCLMSNSGSSANLLAIAALCNPLTEDRLSPGDEVLVPALSWSTTVWPLVQYGLVPVIVDIDPDTLNIDPDEIERAIGPKTRAIMPVHVYGNPCDMGAITAICRRHNLQLIEDACEAMGALYCGRPVGSFGRVGTFSLYYSHHITTLEGGLTVTNDFRLAEIMRMLRAHGWTRELQNPEVWRKEYPQIDPRFLFVNVGYNLRATEVQAAIGSIQLPKLDGFVARRRENTAAWRRDLSCWREFFTFQQELPGAVSSCFGFPMTVKPSAPFRVREFMEFLKARGVETRPIIAGNIAAQPAMKLFSHRVQGDLQNSNRVMAGGVTFGNHQDIGPAARAYVNEQIEAFMGVLGLADGAR